jgi:4'-phosphopantetheinyl transferase EntD
LPADFLGGDVCWAVEPVGDHEAALHPDEAACVVRAVDKRRREFAAGRLLARRLLAGLGVADAPLRAGDDRCPLWPSGVVGSISHSASTVFVAVARTSEVRAVGVDVEGAEPLEDALWDMVLSLPERRWLATQPAEAQGALAKLFFSAKECAYKTQYPITKCVLEFGDVQLGLDAAAGAFEARMPGAIGKQLGGPVRGRLQQSGGQVFAAAVLRA